MYAMPHLEDNVQYMTTARASC